MGGAADRARPRLADGGADQEPRRVRLRPAADPADAVRDANLYAVEKIIAYAVEHRDEVSDLAEQQKGQTAEEIAAAQAELMGGATTVAELEAKLAEAGHPIAKGEATSGAAEADSEVAIAAGTEAPLDIPPPPTESVRAVPGERRGRHAVRRGDGGSECSPRRR